MRLGDVVDQFLNQNGLADAGAAEQADLAALCIGGQEVDDLDAGDENLGSSRLIGKARRLLMDGAGVGCLDRPQLVHRLTADVHDAAE